MKLAFSTLGCPGWSWDEIFATAKDLGYDGIEIRGIGKHIFAPSASVFTGANIENAARRLKASGLEVPMLATGITLLEQTEQQIMSELQGYLNLARALDARFLRVMATSGLRPQKGDEQRAASLYAKICDASMESDVTPLIETNGMFASTVKMREFMLRVGRPNAGVLWDIHHPFRFAGETPAQTVRNLGGLIRYVHVKDSVLRDGDAVYRMMGYGDVPVLDALRALAGSGYDGYVSLEWLKRWCPDLEEPGVVFAHFINYMEYLFRQL